MSRIDTWRRRAAHPGPAEGHGPWRVGWSGPGRVGGGGPRRRVGRGRRPDRAGPGGVLLRSKSSASGQSSSVLSHPGTSALIASLMLMSSPSPWAGDSTPAGG